MPFVYFETDKLKDLSNIELIRKQKEIVNKCSLSQRRGVPSEVVQQLFILEEAYTAELDRRVMEGLIDDDDLEEEYEDY